MKVLLLATVREFFRQRAGFFLVLLFLIFGFLTSREHYAFAQFFLTDPWGMPTLFVIWIGYALLCVQFINHQFTRPEFVFLHGARLWPLPIRLYRLGVMAVGFIQPLLYYGIYVVFVAIQEGVFSRTLPMFVFWLVLGAGLLGVAEWRLRHPDVASSVRKGGFSLPFRRPVSVVFWTLEWLLRERGLTLLLTKLGATLFVLATLVYDRTGDYDLRLPAIGFTLAYLMNSGLSYELYYWESEVWLWGRSLPVSSPKKFLTLVLLHAILLLPETLFALRDGGTQFSWWEWVQLYALGVSCLLLHHARLYRQEIRLEDTGTFLFFGYVVLTFVILYSVPIWVISLVLLVGADLIWFREKSR
jgi:hypothetical protein